MLVEQMPSRSYILWLRKGDSNSAQRSNRVRCFQMYLCGEEREEEKISYQSHDVTLRNPLTPVGVAGTAPVLGLCVIPLEVVGPYIR